MLKIISHIVTALEGWELNAKVIINSLRGQELNSISFRRAILEQIENRLFHNLKSTLGFDVNFSIPIPSPTDVLEIPTLHSFGPSIPFNFGYVSSDKNTIINLIINTLFESSLWDTKYNELRFELYIRLVYYFEGVATKYEVGIPEKEKKYFELTRSLPIVINIKDLLLIVQPHIEHKDHMEIFIHFPDNNVRADNVIIKLNETEIPLDCFTFHKNTRFLNRQNNVLLYGVTPFNKLKSNINTLHVFYKNMETMLSFNIE